MEKNGNSTADAPQFDEEVCERYLFGELTEAEQEEFETAYFNDDAFFEKFAAVKTELLDLYARGELDAGKRARMQPHFLATAPRRKRIEESSDFIRAVTQLADRERGSMAASVVSPKASWLDSLRTMFTVPRLAGALAVFVVVAGVALFISRSRQSVEQVVESPASEIIPANKASETLGQAAPPNTLSTPSVPERADATRSPELPLHRQNNRQTAREQRKKIDSNVASQKPPRRSNKSGEKNDVPHFALVISGVGRDDRPLITLDPGSTRAPEAGNTLKLEGDDDDRLVNIGLLFNDDRYAKYLVTIATVDGQEVSRKAFGRRATSKVDGRRRLVVPIGDATVLTSKDYIVKLEGRTANGATETIQEYYFHVERGEVSEPPTKP